MIRLPRTVKVLGVVYQMRSVKDLAVRVENIVNNAYLAEHLETGALVHEDEPIPVSGLTDTDAQIILVDAALGPDKVKVTVLHEVLHAVMGEAGIRDAISSATEEQIVKRMAPILLLALKENPRVYTYLTGRETYRL